MSKFCGVWHFDSEPPSAQEESQVTAALHGAGFSAPQTYRHAGLLMGWAAGCNDPQCQGLWQAPPYVCQWDGRIDNSAQLLSQTGPLAGQAEAETIVALYRQKGIDGLRDVIGDWSLCIWDADGREAVLASDCAGIRPLYYHRGTRSLYWSSSLSDLASWTGIQELDETFVTDFLAYGSSAAATPYAGICAVPAGHAVSIAPEGARSRAYWSLPVHQEIRYRDERTYQEQLLSLFAESVRARLAVDAPACAELSGGLDSSAVVCMANRLRRQSCGASDVVPLSYTHENSADEKFFREVERACGLSGHHLQVDEYSAADPQEVGAAPAWWEPRFRKLARLMAGMGWSVLLTGQLGDFVMGNIADDAGQVAERLAHGQIREAAWAAYAWGRSGQVPLYSILWRGIREASSSWTPPTDPNDSPGAMPASRQDSLVSSVRTRFAERERAQVAQSPALHAPPGKKLRFRAASEAFASRRLQTPEALQHLSYTHPYAHRPLLEFMLTIPSHLVFAPGEPRRLMRRAFADLLPPMILKRRSKGSYALAFRTPLLPMARLMLQQPREIQLVERGYLELPSLVDRLQKFTQGLDCNETHLRQIIILELWLRQRMAPRKPEPAQWKQAVR